MTNDERNRKPECRKTLTGAFVDFVLRVLSFLRISSLVILICEEWFMERGTKRYLPHQTGAGSHRAHPADVAARHCRGLSQINATFSSQGHKMKTKKWIPFLLTLAASGGGVGALRAAEH